MCFQLRQRDVAVPRFGGRATMDLEGDHAGQRDLGIRFGEVDGLGAVDIQPDARAFAANFVLVPVVGLKDLVDHAGLGLSEHAAAAGFIVQRPPPALAHIGLVPDHFVVVGDALGADLNAGVGLRATNEFHLQFENEILIGLLGAEKFVVGNLGLEVAGHHGALFDSEVFQISIPAIEGFAVKNPDRFLSVHRRHGDGQHDCKKESLHAHGCNSGRAEWRKKIFLRQIIF